jgi:predicted DNA-binding protein
VSNEIKRVGLRMPMPVYQKLEEFSKAYGVPVANLINFIVAQWIDNQMVIRDKVLDKLFVSLKEESAKMFNSFDKDV